MDRLLPPKRRVMMLAGANFGMLLWLSRDWEALQFFDSVWALAVLTAVNSVTLFFYAQLIKRTDAGNP
ncbi:MAG: hypothetical protein AAFY56_12245 [Pseudomonadota bacterium]